MSTQAELGTEFSIASEQNRQRFRLLELPPDLLSVITSDDPPILQMKSQEGPPSNALDSNAVLCTPDKTYTLRQVSTSNEVYLAQSLSNTDTFPPQPRLEAIAKCDSTLELQPAKNVSAVPYIKAALPTFSTTGHHVFKHPISRIQLFANIPLSDAECQSAWQDLACFELDGPSRALLPSNGIKLQIWEAVLTSVTARGVDLTEPLPAHDVSRIAEEHDEWPSALTMAVIRSISSQADNHSGYLHIDETKCTRAVGEMLLCDRTHNGRTPMPLRPFLEAWADLLPEKWRSRVEMSWLEGSYKLEDGPYKLDEASYKFETEGQEVNFVESSATYSLSGNAAAPADAKATLGATRKWHEKFRASKKTS